MIPGTIPAEFEFRSKFRRNHLINLAGPSAKFDSSGIPGIARIPPDSGRNQWRTVKTSDFTTFRKVKEGATIIVSWENSPKKEGACPKREIDMDRLQKSLIDL